MRTIGTTSTASIVSACLIAADFAVALACLHRAVAWTVLLFTLVVGGFFAVGGYHESFPEGSFAERSVARALPYGGGDDGLIHPPERPASFAGSRAHRNALASRGRAVFRIARIDVVPA